MIRRRAVDSMSEEGSKSTVQDGLGKHHLRVRTGEKTLEDVYAVTKAYLNEGPGMIQFF